LSCCIYMWSTWLSEDNWVLKETFPLEAVRQVDDCFITFVKHVADCSIMTVHALCKHKNGIRLPIQLDMTRKTYFWSLYLIQHLGRNLYRMNIYNYTPRNDPWTRPPNGPHRQSVQEYRKHDSYNIEKKIIGLARGN